MTTTTPAGLRLRATPAFNGIPCWHCGGRLIGGRIEDGGGDWIHAATRAPECPPGTTCRECCAHEPRCERVPWVGNRYMCADCIRLDDMCTAGEQGRPGTGAPPF